MGLQDVKDTFYAALRDRVAAGNAARQVVVRGVLRPAVVVTENELPGAAVDGIAPVDCFCLRWGSVRLDRGLMVLGCEVTYATDGSAGAGGMDRGRALGAMDAELIAAVSTSPQNAVAVTLSEAVAGAAVTAPTGTRVFWSDVLLGNALLRGARVERTAKLEVYGYE